jgi:HK97 family phage portal protein
MGLLADSLRSWLSSDKALARWLGAPRPVAAGITVNVEAAMRYPPFAAAVTLIENMVATSKLHLYRRVGEGRERAREHPLDRLLSASPNSEQSAHTWRREMMFGPLTTGAAYAEIQRDNSGRPVALWPIDPERVMPERDSAGRPRYRVSNHAPASGQFVNWQPDVTLSDDKLLVILGPGSRDGLTPSSPVDRAREAIGLGLATERFGGTFFGNGANFGGILTHPGKLSENAHNRLRSSLIDRGQGVDRAHNFIILEEAMEYERLGVPPEEAQFLATRQHQINEVARVFNLPPTLIGGNLEGGLTYANSLAEAQRFVDQCLITWASLWEQELNRKLLAPSERDTLYFEMVFESLLRGDVTTRYASYRTAIETGFLTINEVRARENLPALPEAAMTSAATNGNRPRSRPDGADHVIVSEALARVLRRWGADFLRTTSAEDVRQRLARFAGDDEADGHTRQVLETALTLVPGADARGVASTLRAECARDIQRLLDTTAAVHVPARVVQQIDKVWPVRAGSLAAEILRNGGTTHG